MVRAWAAQYIPGVVLKMVSSGVDTNPSDQVYGFWTENPTGVTIEGVYLIPLVLFRLRTRASLLCCTKNLRAVAH